MIYFFLYLDTVVPILKDLVQEWSLVFTPVASSVTSSNKFLSFLWKFIFSNLGARWALVRFWYYIFWVWITVWHLCMSPAPETLTPPSWQITYADYPLIQESWTMVRARIHLGVLPGLVGGLPDVPAIHCFSVWVADNTDCATVTDVFYILTPQRKEW